MSEATLSQRAAEEIRVMLARRNISRSELARRLGVSHTWMTNRLAGHQEIGLTELERIAAALHVEVADLLPAKVRPNDSSGMQDTAPRPRRHRPVRTLTRSATATRPVSAVPLTSRRPKLLRPRTTHRLAR